SSTGLKFGAYKGKNVELNYNSYFYYQLQNVYNYYAQQVGQDNLGSYMYNIYYSAFQNAIINERFQEMATKAGIKPTSSQISDAIVKSGYYSDGASTFSAEVYAQADEAQKEQIVSWMHAYVPFEEVEQLITSAKISSAERNFIESLNASPRSFDYVVVNYGAIPDEVAASYAAEHPALFETVDIRRSTYPTEEAAGNAFTQIAAGTLTMEDAIADSIDSSAVDNGYMEDVYRFVLDNYLASTAPETAAEIFSAAKDSLVGPVQTSEGYTIFYVMEAAEAFDAEGEHGLTPVKGYISQYEGEMSLATLQTVADDIYATAKASSLAEAAEKYGLTVTPCKNVSENPGDSQYVVSLNYGDVGYVNGGAIANGYLYQATLDDKAYSDKLFNTAYGTVLEPVTVSGAIVIAVPVEAESDNVNTIDIVKSFYDSYAQQHQLQDMENATFNSDDVEDNFVSAYIQAVFGSAAN
ncbi:MAG: peptidyl-prolyl cis-trans isomerase, partial [Spirochaetales bacterium]|nr:peptidyl-prolyl cis-trans isomerase [Candidatus Physcosoma equi]